MFGMLSISRGLIGSTVLLLAVFGAAAVRFCKPAGPLRQEWSVQFVPARLVLPADLPSVHEANVTLCNLGSREVEVRLSSCCGVEVHTTAPRNLKADQCTNIPLRVNVKTPGIFRGAVYVYVRGVQSPVAVLPVVGEAYESVIDKGRVPSDAVLYRANPNAESSELCFGLRCRSGFTITEVSSPADWLAVRLRKSQKAEEICLKALADAPEGRFLINIPVSYRVKQRTGRDEITIAGEVVSRVRIEPSILFFGIISLQQQQTLHREAELVLRTAADEPLHIRVDHPDFTVRVRRTKPNVAVLQVAFTPRYPGEVRAKIECLQAGRVLCVLPASALVEP